ncbi:MAG: S8 family serine peptidase, partial [Gemmatimonadales bacterium]
PDLARIQPLGRFRLPPGRRSREPQPVAPAAQNDTCDPGGDPVYGPSATPLRRLNLFPLIARGADGSGVRVALLDSGFDTANPAFGGVTVVAQRDFVFGDDTVRDELGVDVAGAHAHGTAVWSLLAGDVPGRLRGVARAASYLLAKTEDVRSETRVEEDHYVAALEWTDSIGVDIVSSSLSYLVFDNGFGYMPSEVNGDVAVTTVAADAAVARGITIVTAAGNNGPDSRSIWTPADGDSVIAVGAEDSLGTVAPFSSRGPSADGRIKPDFTAPGVAICAVTGRGRLGRVNGTSFATPLVAAGVALLKQMQPVLTPLDVRDALRAAGANRSAPDTIRGWGRPDFAAAAGVSNNGLEPVEPVTSPLTTVTPTFSWTPLVPLVPPVSYRLRIAQDSVFAQLLVDTIVGTAESVDLRRALKPGIIFWRAYGRDAAGDTASTGRVGPLAVPLWATLTALSDPAGAVIDSLQPTFTWTSPPVASPPGPYSYDLFVRRVTDTAPAFATTGLTGTSFRLPVPLERNSMYRWSLVVHLASDTSLAPSRGTFLVVDGGTPTATLLYQNFPNPFPAVGRDSTCLWFDLAVPGRVELEILDLRGNRVRRFIPGPDFPAILPAGRYGRGQPGGTTCDPRLMWDGRADDGHPLPPGVYVSKLKAPGLVAFKRIVYRGR